MNFYDRDMEVLHCAGCGQVEPLYSKIITNPFRMACVLESFSQTHSKCERIKNVSKARLHRRWDKIAKLLPNDLHAECTCVAR